MKILVVEDDPISALVLTDALESMGHEPTVAENGIEAWRHIQQEGFRLIISDWMMPEMDGIELCKRIRTMQGLTYPFVILLTAKSQREDRLEALRAGADDFLVKPLDPEELVARIEVAKRILDLQSELRKHLVEISRKRIEERGAALSKGNTLVDSASLALRHSEIFDALPFACMTLDRTGQIGDFNKACEELFGITPQLTGKLNYASVVPDNEDEQSGEAIMARVFAGETVRDLERILQRPDGTTVRMVNHISPVAGMGGDIVAAISVFVECPQAVAGDALHSGQRPLSHAPAR